MLLQANLLASTEKSKSREKKYIQTIYTALKDTIFVGYIRPWRLHGVVPLDDNGDNDN